MTAKHSQTQLQAVEVLDGAKESYPKAYLQNRELSWLDFDARVLDQGSDPNVPLLERLNFISIFWSNLQEFFMIRVGSLTDLTLLKKAPIDSKTGWTPSQQLDAIFKRVRELYPVQEQVYNQLRSELANAGIKHLRPEELNPEQTEFVMDYARINIVPFLSPQIINPRHPFPHLENGKLYYICRLNESDLPPVKSKSKQAESDPNKRNVGAKDATLGLIPLPSQCPRLIRLPGKEFSFVLLEHALEMVAPEVFSMYSCAHSNIICVTRNADLDMNEGMDETDADYRTFMKRILKKRSRLAPVRLETQHPITSKTMEKHLLKRLELKRNQVYTTSVPLDLSFTYDLPSMLGKGLDPALVNTPFTPAWPASLDPGKPIMEQVTKHEVLLSYPYHSMDPLVQLLREAATDPAVTSIKITLYRLARRSLLAEALIAAAENGKEVVALFELRARFDENNNIEWSHRFEEAGCKVIYGFENYKVHSKICSITKQTPQGPVYITQLGTGNYNEKTAKLYTDFSFITSDPDFGRDATVFFRNMSLENVSNEYKILRVAPLQIKPMIMGLLDEEIAKAQQGLSCGAFFKTNSVTDMDIIEKIVEASQAGVPVVMYVRGICCLLPGVEGYTENVRVVSIVGRLLEHSRIYCFGTGNERKVFLSSADCMTRNMDNRIEIAWPVLNPELRDVVFAYIEDFGKDTAKLRKLLPDGSYTPLRFFRTEGKDLYDAQAHGIIAAAAEERDAVEARAKLTASQRLAASARAEQIVQELQKGSEESRLGLGRSDGDEAASKTGKKGLLKRVGGFFNRRIPRRK